MLPKYIYLGLEVNLSSEHLKSIHICLNSLKLENNWTIKMIFFSINFEKIIRNTPLTLVEIYECQQ